MAIRKEELKELQEVLDLLNFKAYEENGKIVLKDLEGANLGNIESEAFDTPGEVLERLDHYVGDTILDPEILVGRTDVEGWETCEEALAWCKTHPEGAWCVRALELIIKFGD